MILLHQMLMILATNSCKGICNLVDSHVIPRASCHPPHVTAKETWVPFLRFMTLLKFILLMRAGARPWTQTHKIMLLCSSLLEIWWGIANKGVKVTFKDPRHCPTVTHNVGNSCVTLSHGPIWRPKHGKQKMIVNWIFSFACLFSLFLEERK